MAEYSEEILQACCSVKTMSLTKQEDGSITASVTGLEGDLAAVLSLLMRVENNDYTVSSWRREGAYITATATSNVNNSFEKIPTGMIFKTIPQDIYDLHMSDIIPRSIHSPLEAPDSEVRIKPSTDIYGAEGGWKVSDILKELRIKAEVPANFDYHVYQLTANRGAPVISLLHNLLPIPGLIIERYFGRYYINIANGTGYFGAPYCELVGTSSKTQTYDNIVVGVPGEPRYIDAEPETETQEDGTVVQYNLVRGIWGITESVSSQSDDTERVETMFGDNLL